MSDPKKVDEKKEGQPAKPHFVLEVQRLSTRSGSPAWAG